jgi:hypothetical protein
MPFRASFSFIGGQLDDGEAVSGTGDDDYIEMAPINSDQRRIAPQPPLC